VVEHVVCTALSANRPLVDLQNHMLNDLVARAFAAAGVPVPKEPVGLVRQDGKRPDGLTLIPFEGGRSLTWDVTVVCTTADSYIDLAMQCERVSSFLTAHQHRKAIQCHTWYERLPCRVLLCGGDGSLLQGGEIRHFADSLLISSRSRSRPWVLSMSWPIFCTIWGGAFRSRAGRTESLSFCFSAFQSPSSALMRCFCATISCRPTTRISIRSRLQFSSLIFHSSPSVSEMPGALK